MSVSISDSESLLKKALNDMNKKWAATADSWHDSARKDFETEHLDPLRVAADKAYLSMRNMDQLLRAVVRDCK